MPEASTSGVNLGIPTLERGDVQATDEGVRGSELREFPLVSFSQTDLRWVKHKSLRCKVFTGLVRQVQALQTVMQQSRAAQRVPSQRARLSRFEVLHCVLKLIGKPRWMQESWPDAQGQGVLRGAARGSLRPRACASASAPSSRWRPSS